MASAPGDAFKFPGGLGGGSREPRLAPATLVGTVITSRDPILAERLASAFDFVWIDLEHSALSARDVQDLTIAARAGGAAAFVRVPQFDSELIPAVLDMGVDGIVAPRVSRAEDADQFAAAVNYPPAGTRGYAPRRGTAGDAQADGATGILTIAQIETAKGLANVNEIAATSVNALVVGANDLSFELGEPLDLGSERLANAVGKVQQAAGQHGKTWGLAVSRLDTPALPAVGVPLMVYASDIKLYFDAIEDCTSNLRRRLSQARSAP